MLLLFETDHYANRTFYGFIDFCIKKYPGTQGEVCRQLQKKIMFLNSRVAYATDRSKAVVPVLFLFCVALWFILRGASRFKVFLCSLCLCFVIPFSIEITSLGEEGAGLCAYHAFIFLFCTCQFLSFFSSSWCRGGCGL